VGEACLTSVVGGGEVENPTRGGAGVFLPGRRRRNLGVGKTGERFRTYSKTKKTGDRSACNKTEGGFRIEKFSIQFIHILKNFWPKGGSLREKNGAIGGIVPKGLSGKKKMYIGIGRGLELDNFLGRQGGMGPFTLKGDHL